jgi:nitroreductase
VETGREPSGQSPVTGNSVLRAIEERGSGEYDDTRYDSEQRYFLDVIKKRRTVRKFRPDVVPERDILTILDAARFAPTAGNQQPWKFLVIRDRSKLERLKKEAVSWYLGSHREKARAPREQEESARDRMESALANVLSAPVYVAVLVDSTSKYPDYVIHDGILAAGNLMNAACSLGYGTGFFTTFFPEEQMKRFLDIPARYKLICFTPIGVPETWPDAPSKKDLDELVAFESLSDTDD